MTLTFMDEARAENAFGDVLKNWVESDNYRGCYSAAETEQAIRLLEIWSARSRTATDIIKFVREADQEVVVVGMHGGFQAFDNSARDAVTGVSTAAVFVDLAGQINTHVRTPHTLHLQSQVLDDREVVEFDNRIALLHELGHAKQWLERPLLFEGHALYGNPSVFRDAIHAAAGEFWLAKLDAEGEPPEPFVPTIAAIECAPVWSVRLESDNMARHEWPICKELGLPKRSNYGDLRQGRPDAPAGSGTSRIVTEVSAATEERRRIEERKEENRRLEKARQAAKRSQKEACEKCAQMFTKMQMRGHHLTCN